MGRCRLRGCCGSDILLAIHFPLAHLVASFQHSIAFLLSLVISLSCTVASTILTSFRSLAPASKRSSHRYHTFRSSFGSEKMIIFRSVRRYFCLNNRWPGSRSLCCLSHPRWPCVFRGVQDIELWLIIRKHAISFRIVYHQSVNRWILKYKSST